MESEAYFATVYGAQVTICSITGYACDCQPDEGIPCDGIRKLRDACESWKKQSIERGQQIEAAKHDIERLTAACSAEATEVEQLRGAIKHMCEELCSAGDCQAAWCPRSAEHPKTG